MKSNAFLRIIGFAALLAGILAGLGCSRGGKPVAKISGKKITAEQWRVFLETHGVAPNPTPEALQDALQRLVRRAVSANLAEKRGLLKGPEWERKKTSLIDMALLQALLETKDPAKLAVTEAEVRAYFNKHEEARELRRIVCESEDRAREALDQIKGGKAFDEVARSYSAEPSPAPEWVRYEQMPEALGDSIFASPKGQVVGPLPAGSAWILVETVEIRAPEPDAFEANRGELTALLKSERLQEVRERVGKELKEKTPLSLHPDVIRSETSLEVKAGDEKKVVASLAGVSVSVEDLKRFAAEFGEASGEKPPEDPEALARLAESLALNKALVQQARSDGIDRRPRALALVWDTVEEAAGRAFALDYVGKLPIPEETLRTFYAENPGPFAQQAGLRIRMVGAQAPAVLSKAVEAMRKGMPFGEALRKFGPEGLQAPKEEAVWIPMEEVGQAFPEPIARALASAPPGTWVGPVNAGQAFHAFQVVERQAARVVPFEEAGPRVREAFLKEKGQGLVFEYLDGPGREGIPIETYPENTALQKKK